MRRALHRRLRGAAVAAALLLAPLLAGACGSSGGAVSVPQVGAAKTFELAGFQPAGAIAPGRPTTVTFTVREPSGAPLATYKTGPGPHTGVHLIIVRDDLAYIVHVHPRIGAGGLIRETVTLPAPGRYDALVDVYPELAGVLPNFQLFHPLTVTGAYTPVALPPFRSEVTVDGYSFVMAPHAPLHAIQAQFLEVQVSDQQGNPVTFEPWFGALAHAIFFHEGSLHYFHTHVCAHNAPNCGSLAGVGSTRVTGQSTAPGRLRVGVLLPEAGNWRLFLQVQLDGKVVTAPWTLTVLP